MKYSATLLTAKFASAIARLGGPCHFWACAAYRPFSITAPNPTIATRMCRRNVTL